MKTGRPKGSGVVAPIERIMRRTVEDESGCWIFTGALTHRGYGPISTPVGHTHTHRVTYEYFIAEIPDGLHIDHLCRNRACCNPWHLDPVTNEVNKTRSRGLIEPTRNACSNGHEWTAGNTYRAPNGIRHCRECQRARSRSYKQRKRQEIAP